jgi:hypothetical protein
MKRIMIFYARMEAAEETRDALNDKVVSIVLGQASSQYTPANQSKIKIKVKIKDSTSERE